MSRKEVTKMNGSMTKEEAEYLFNTYAQYVYRGALFLVHSEQLAEDITQEVFIKVFKKYETFDQSKEIKPWLYKIMLNTARNTLRNKPYELQLDENILQIDQINIEHNCVEKEDNQKLWKVVCKLSTKTKEVIYLHYYLEMTLEEIAGVLDIPVGTCKSRLNAGLSKLRQKVGMKRKFDDREVTM